MQLAPPPRDCISLWAAVHPLLSLLPRSRRNLVGSHVHARRKGREAAQRLAARNLGAVGGVDIEIGHPRRLQQRGDGSEIEEAVEPQVLDGRDVAAWVTKFRLQRASGQ